ncbi:transmembrane protein, putative (macronuclear) [Tetrahymena thermophila SB210]|uniref:Transmembrane protein, putative n=1 Tax=Tetrahymena thermophila (strain SB210) TaxID=312017 RepID=W7XCJ9_TETTS|nr:transmembrane protein, putative [Tetrahymena thermophila SB210]EWS75192.1 transmembrane protein, putative [Tetrahymena thermophila SB210]|eukprot:XP_012652183.1 transmembrane protein, putative [Tetrahymena thermophila SB210]
MDVLFIFLLLRFNFLFQISNLIYQFLFISFIFFYLFLFFFLKQASKLETVHSSKDLNLTQKERHFVWPDDILKYQLLQQTDIFDAINFLYVKNYAIWQQDNQKIIQTFPD